MSAVNGIGGCFIFSEAPEALASWYASSFGLSFEQYGETNFFLTFAAADLQDPSVRRETVFSIMKAKSPVPTMAKNSDPGDMYGDQPFMVNLRVNDLTALLAELDSKGIPILGRQDEPYGAFAWIRDPEGRRIELWQPSVPFTA